MMRRQRTRTYDAVTQGDHRLSIATTFLDRDRERAVLDELLQSVRYGLSGALVVHGEAGMGKSALLDYAASSVDLPVVRISGVETESSFGFAALHRLLLPLLQEIHQVPEPQRIALESAFGFVDGPPPDRFLVALAALSLLSTEGIRSGLLCIVDDAQWIDTESLLTLALIARRLHAESIALLFGIRTFFDVPADLAGIPTLEIIGLPPSAAAEVLHAAAGSTVPVELVERITSETEGCPLALWELGGTFGSGQWQRIGVPTEPIVITRRLELHFSEQVRLLSPDAQLFVLAAAADTSGDRSLVWAAARALGCGPDCEAEAQRQRLLTVRGKRIAFRHPLIRSAVYGSADPDTKRDVHRVYAELVSKARDPDRWAGHVVLSAVGPDAAIASELEATAQIARARGGFTAEATLFVHAADLSESPDQRAVRRLHAAEAAMNAGATSQALELLSEAESDLTDDLSIAQAYQLRAGLNTQRAMFAIAPSQFTSAARLLLPLDTSRAGHAVLEAFAAYQISQHHTSDIDADEIAEVAQAVMERSNPSALQDYLIASQTRLVTGHLEAAARDYQMAADLMRGAELPHDQVRWAVLGNQMALEFFDDETQHIWADRMIRSARENGALSELLFNLLGLADVELHAGRLSSANACYEEALEIASAIGMPTAYLSLMSVEAQAWAGNEAATQESAAQLIALGPALGAGIGELSGYHALAISHLGAARYDKSLEAANGILTQRTIGPASQHVLPFAIEAAMRSGERNLAESLLRRLDHRATATGSSWALGLTARSRALVSQNDTAAELFEEALTLLRRTRVARDVAHTQLLYGEWLRRQRRRVDARQQLRAARDFFVQMGAKGFTVRAEAELRATGERVHAQTPAEGSDLTPQELRVATLAAEHLTNAEIATQLFLSSATVDYHLRKVYRKLSIDSRRQLVSAMSR